MTMKTRDLKTVLAMLNGRPPKRLREQGAELMERNRAWLSAPEIQGMGIGERVSNGQRQKQMVLKVYVDRKRPSDQVSHLIPAKQMVPGTDWELEIDVEEVGKLHLEAAFTGHQRPVRPGWGVSHESGSMGTIGCLVRLNGDATGVYLLSCAHVLAKAGQATIGDKVVQPAQEIDGSFGDRTVATLTKSIPLNIGGTSVADAAIAKVTDGLDVDASIQMSFRPPRGIVRHANLKISSPMFKVGAQSGETNGAIRDRHFTFKVNYPGVGDTTFTNLVMCQNFTVAGDSGAAVLNSSGRIAGIHVAGSDSVSVFCPIEPILKELEIEVLTKQP